MQDRGGLEAPRTRGSRTLWPSLIVGFIPYAVMVVGIPFVNSGREVLGLPELGLWIIVWVVLASPFLVVAHRLLPPAERDEADVPPENDPPAGSAQRPDRTA